MQRRRRVVRTSSSPLARLALVLGVAAAVVVPAQGASALPGAPSATAVVASTPKAHLSKTPKPSVHGSLRAGSVLRVATGTWAPGTVRVHLRWLRDGRPIAGAIHRGYIVKTADQGARLSVRVVGSKKGYRTVSRTSASRLVIRTVERVPAIVAATPAAATPAIASAAPLASVVPAAPVAAPQTKPATSTAGTAAILGDGDWTVGKDVQPGVYVTSAATTSCYWKTVSSFDGRFESIHHNDIGSGQRIMEVQAGDHGVTTQWCGSWVRQADASPIGTIGAGEYLVGQQVRSGTYRVQVPTDGCYWSTVSDFTGSVASIIENDYLAGPATATVVVPDAAKGFKTSSCGPWTRVD